MIPFQFLILKVTLLLAVLCLLSKQKLHYKEKVYKLLFSLSLQLVDLLEINCQLMTSGLLFFKLLAKMVQVFQLEKLLQFLLADLKSLRREKHLVHLIKLHLTSFPMRPSLHVLSTLFSLLQPLKNQRQLQIKLFPLCSSRSIHQLLWSKKSPSVLQVHSWMLHCHQLLQQYMLPAHHSSQTAVSCRLVEKSYLMRRNLVIDSMKLQEAKTARKHKRILQVSI